MPNYIKELLYELEQMKRAPKNYTYILLCADGSYYCGWTNDPVKRLKAHNEGKASKYTRARLPVSFVYIEEFETKSEAMREEVRIKRLSRSRKKEMIEAAWKYPYNIDSTP